MNVIRKKHLSSWLLSALLAAGMASGVQATTETQSPIDVSDQTPATQPEMTQELAEPRFLILQDKFHHMTDSLTNRHPIHYYGFVAARGQDVLLALLDGNPAIQLWKVEYYENGVWILQNTNTKVFSKLAPGAELIIRVSPRHPGKEKNISYSINFGSNPVLKSYDLHDEPGVIRIPSGYSEPSWLATQAYKEAFLDAKFTDTTGAPLEGGLIEFTLRFKGGDPTKLLLLSDANGSVSKRIELGRCYGGAEARDFVDKHTGFNTWRTYYKVAGYTTQNLSAGTASEMPHAYYLGHICTQRLIQTVRPRN